MLNPSVAPQAFPVRARRLCISLCVPAMLVMAACDHGLEPPPETPFGVISGTVTYGGQWPPPDSVLDLRFVAFRFVPRDTADFYRLNEFVFSRPLRTFVEADAFVIDSVQAGPYVYNGIAQKFGAGAIDWRPVALYTENGGTFVVPPHDTAHVHVTVDFRSPPIFPPE